MPILLPYEVEPDSYPNQEWGIQSERYATWMKYFDGSVFEETVDGDPKTLKYPVGINYCQTVAMISSWAMLGDWRDSVFSWRSLEGKNEAAVDFLGRVSRVSRMNSRYVRQILTHTVLGGMVWGIKKNPLLPTGLQWTAIPPEIFFPVYSSLDDDLVEVLIRTTIGAREAKLVWGVDANSATVPYHEVWNKSTFEVIVGDKLAKSGNTPGGVIPFEYIPRINVTGEFYGMSAINEIMRLQDEMNARMADIGDAVNRETHKPLITSNLPGGIKGIREGNGVMDLGMGFSGAKPEVHDSERAQIPTGALDSLNMTLDFARYSAGTPPVAFGEDQGSQRSSQTLTVRMWPLVQGAKNNRAFVTDGMARLAHKTLMIAGGAANSGYFEPDLPPILPKDREQIVNEIAVLRANELVGDEQALEMLDVPETDRAEWLAGIEKLRQAAKELMEASAMQKQQNQNKSSGGSNAGSR